MHKFQRPAEPDNFAAQTLAARQKVEDHFLPSATPAVAGSSAPASPAVIGATPASAAAGKTAPKKKAKPKGTDKKEELFPGIWSKHKQRFTRAQRGKCAYCEGAVLGLQYGDVEHIRPKAEIHALPDDPAKWGKEGFWSSSVEGRKAEAPVIKPGYWWLAYDWSNYLLSCQICNQQWKANFFPVQGKHPNAPPTTGAVASTCSPLLLSPFELDFDPSKHFDYGRLGEIIHQTERGRATIGTCGLDRPSLRLARYKLARATHEHLDEIARDVTERDVLRVLTYIERDGDETQPFCGMVRTIFTRRTQLSWDQLAEVIDKLRRSRTLDHALCEC